MTVVDQVWAFGPFEFEQFFNEIFMVSFIKFKKYRFSMNKVNLQSPLFIHVSFFEDFFDELQGPNLRESFIILQAVLGNTQMGLRPNKVSIHKNKLVVNNSYMPMS